MQLAWKLGIGGVLIVLLVRFLIRFVAEAKRVNHIKREIDAESDRVRNLPVEEAEVQARQVMNSNAILEPWGGPIPREILDKLERIDVSIQSIFRNYRRCRFAQTGTEGTELKADFLLAKPSHDGALQVGADLMDESIQHKFLATPGSPVIVEINEDGRVIGEYPSIYHFLLLTEAKG